MPGKLGMATVIGLGLVGVTSAQAEEIKLDELLVTAGRVPVEAEKVGRAHTVVTGEEIEKRQIRYVADALRTVPGLAVSRNGSTGGLTQVRIRGAEANHVLVLIDGIEVSDISHSAYDFSGLQASDVERIEVLRGPQSSLYGANAMAGVIHIITKKGERNSAPKVSAQAETGTDGTLMGSVSTRGGADKFDYALSLAWRRSDGINTAQNGSEKDENKNLTFNGKTSIDLAEDLTLDLGLRVVKKKADTDAFGTIPGTTMGGAVDNRTNNVESREFFTSAGLTHSPWDGQFVQKANIKFADSNRRGNTDSAFPYGNNSKRVTLNYQGTVFLETPTFADAKHSLTGAAEWERETYKNVHGSSAYSRKLRDRDMTGLVAEYRGEFWDNLFLTGAVRHDINENFKDATTYSASAAYLIKQTGTRLHGSIGTGVTNPSFYEQFGSSSNFVGNPNLKPEENFGWDVGIEQSLFDDRFVVDVTYFKERMKNEIQYQRPTVVNLEGTSKRQGIEVSATAKITDDLQVKASYTYLDATEPNGQQEVRRPKHSGAINVSQSFMEKRGNVFVDTIFNANMTDTQYTMPTYARSEVKLDDFVVMNVGADFKLNDNVQLYGRIENLFDADYEEIHTYNTAGRTAYVGIRANF